MLHRRSLRRQCVVARLVGLLSAVVFLLLGSLAILTPVPAGADTAPTVTAVSPDIGPVAGGTVVTVTGTDFDSTTTVDFGTIAATDVTVTSPTTLSATSPANVGGSFDVTVTTADTGGDTSATSPADLFAYGPPTVTGLSPGAGPLTGGSVVTVTGTAFVPGATVSFGTTAATDVSVTSATTLTATAPAGLTVDPVDVTVTTPPTDGGTSPTSVDDLFAYGPPTATALTPSTGPANTPTTITITGTDFSPGDAVTFGLTPATAVTVWGPTVITADAPTSLAGGASVTVSNPDGSSPTSVAMQFAAGPPTVTGVSPAAGPAGGGGTVIVTGDGFVAGSTVDFGGVAAAVTVTSPTSLVATAPPPGGPGSVDVTVTNPQGPSTTSVQDLYAYGVPTVSSVAPDTATLAGATTVTVTGSGFVPGVVVSFGSAPGTGVAVNATGTSLQVTSPAGAAGSVDLTVTSPAGTSLTSIDDLFAYGAPVVNSVAPDAGPLVGGNDVIVAGNGFVPGVTVYFGDQVSSSATVLAGGRVSTPWPRRARRGRSTSP